MWEQIICSHFFFDKENYNRHIVPHDELVHPPRTRTLGLTGSASARRYGALGSTFFQRRRTRTKKDNNPIGSIV